MTDPRLVISASDISAGYAGAPVIRNVTMDARAGEITAILGANGAGKTTLLRALSGRLAPMSGQIYWLGHEASGPLHRRVRNGLRYVTEERSVLMTLTVRENLRLGRQDSRRAFDLFPELVPLVGRKAGLLSGGEQQMLAVARAIAASPKALLIDELSLGLAPLVVTRLFQAIRSAADDGAAVLMVEQHVHRALGVADRAVVLRRGAVEMTGTADEIRSRERELEASYLTGATTGEDGDTAKPFPG